MSPALASRGSAALVWLAVVAAGCGRFGYGGRSEQDASPPTDAAIEPGDLGPLEVLVDEDVGLGSPAIAWDGSGFSILYSGSSNPADLRYCRVSPDGALLLAPRTLISDATLSVGEPDLDASESVLSSAYLRDGNPTEVWFVTFNIDGIAVVPREIFAAIEIKEASVVFAHKQHAVAMAYNKGIMLARIPDSLGDAVLNDVVAEDSAMYAHLVPTGDEYLLFWTDQRTGSAVVYGVKVGTDASVGDPIAITNNDEGQSGPTVAISGDTVGVAWATLSPAEEVPATVRFRTLTEPGLELGEPVTVFGEFVGSPRMAMAASGGSFALAAELRTTLGIALIDASGPRTVVDSRPDVVLTRPDIAWGDDRFGVVWIEVEGGLRRLRYRWLLP